MLADGLLGFWVEGKGEAVETIPQTRGGWTILEHVPEMTEAAGAVNFGTRPNQSVIGPRSDMSIVDRGPEAGPASAAVILGFAREERQVTTGAVVCARALFPVEGARVCAFRPLFAEDFELIGRDASRPVPFRQMPPFLDVRQGWRLGLWHVGCPDGAGS